MIHIVLQEGKLAGTGKAGTGAEKRRRDFKITMLAGMEIEHEVDQGPGKQGTVALEKGEVSAADLARPRKVGKREGVGDIEMIAGWKIKLSWLSFFLDQAGGNLAQTDRNGRMGNVGDPEEEFFETLLYFPGLLVEGADPDGQLLHLRHPGQDISAGPFPFPDLMGNGVTGML
jgi:hypothetical protein